VITMMHMKTDTMLRGDETVVAVPLGERLLVWLALPLLGAGAGWLLSAIAGWVAGLPWAPFQGPFKLVASLPEPHVTIGALLLGASAGLLLALMAAEERMTVAVADDRLTIVRGDAAQTLPRGAIGGLFVEGKSLVLLSPAGAELARETADLNVAGLREALRAHGYPPLADGDPHEGSYQRWLEDAPELGPRANALLRARARALEKNDKEDAALLRAELAKLGVVVRDEKRRQYWRSC
jgi:hypothetical protein